MEKQTPSRCNANSRPLTPWQRSRDWATFGDWVRWARGRVYWDRRTPRSHAATSLRRPRPQSRGNGGCVEVSHTCYLHDHPVGTLSDVGQVGVARGNLEHLAPHDFGASTRVALCRHFDNTIPDFPPFHRLCRRAQMREGKMQTIFRQDVNKQGMCGESARWRCGHPWAQPIDAYWLDSQSEGQSEADLRFQSLCEKKFRIFTKIAFILHG